jgi:glutamate 5-kinase
MARRIVFKFGSGILTSQERVDLDGEQLEKLTGAVAALRLAGNECVVVSSGAVAAGLPSFQLKERPKVLSVLQACAAVGQTRLMHYYQTLFREHELHVGQLLLTHEDLRTPERRENVSNTLNQLLSFSNIVPVINENDSVAVEELRYGDNDLLSADVAKLIDADVLVLLTTVDGLLPPDSDQIIPQVDHIDEVLGYATAEKGGFSVGGMATKLRSAQRATEAGIDVYIANGRRPEQLGDLLAGKGIGTYFPSKVKMP